MKFLRSYTTSCQYERDFDADPATPCHVPVAAPQRMPESPNITQLLTAWSRGDRDALDALMPHVMRELKRIAAGYLAREAHADTLQVTALVHEAYLRLVHVKPESWENRTRFFALAAQIMRRILVDHARAQLGPRRGGAAPHVPIDEALVISAESTPSLVRLDDALLSLERQDVRKSRIVELRVFGGLTNGEVAEVLGISERTVLREWQFAKAWLAQEVERS
jgi:RNA polymerase sigma-70 factor (ECF subfamily)